MKTKLQPAVMNLQLPTSEKKKRTKAVGVTKRDAEFKSKTAPLKVNATKEMITKNCKEQIEIRTLQLTAIRTGGGTLTRLAIDDDVVADYLERMRAGDKFPPVVVYYDGTKHWLADGHHRLKALGQLGVSEISAEVRPGTVLDALKYALSANTTHGLRRSNGDKRNAVKIALRHPELSKLSSRQIADLCAVSHSLVDSIRTQLADSANSTRTGADGKKYPCGKKTEQVANAASPTLLSSDDTIVDKTPTIEHAADVVNDRTGILFTLADGTTLPQSDWQPGWLAWENVAKTVNAIAEAATNPTWAGKQSTAEAQRFTTVLAATINLLTGNSPTAPTISNIKAAVEAIGHVVAAA